MRHGRHLTHGAPSMLPNGALTCSTSTSNAAFAFVLFHINSQGFQSGNDTPFPPVFGVLLLENLPLGLDDQSCGGMIAPAQFNEVGAKLAEHFPVDFAILIQLVLSSHQKTRHGQERHVVSETTCVFAQLRCVSFDAAHCFQGILLEEPFAVTTLAPLGEILLAHGFSVEFAFDHGAHRRKRVEPRDQRAALFAVLEAAVELLADFAGKTGDFAIARFIHGLD
jgi:hypothetical protein